MPKNDKPLSKGTFSDRLNDWIIRATSYGRSSTHRLDYLDGWRGFAIAMVLYSHFVPFGNWMPYGVVQFGRMGVDFFFVLSGVLMSNILFVKRVPLKTFYKRRISRVFPVFFLYVCSIYGISWLNGPHTETGNFLYTLSFLRSYFPAGDDIWRTDLPIAHLWSLNVEEHCYVILSLVTLLWFVRKREYLVLLPLSFLAIVIHYLYVRFPGLTPGRIPVVTETASSHLLMSAGYFLIRDKFDPYVRGWMVVGALVLGFFAYSNYAPWHAYWTIAPIAFAFSINHLARLPKPLLAVFSFRPIQLLGILSYSIYLWQEPFAHQVMEGYVSFPGARIVMALAGITLGVISFYLLENPIRRFLNNRW